MNLTYVVAPIYNDIEFVLMAFLTEHDARLYMSELGLVEKDYDGKFFYNSVLVNDRELPLCEAMLGASDKWREAFLRTGYYDDGNGEISELHLRTLPIGTPVVNFNLD